MCSKIQANVSNNDDRLKILIVPSSPYWAHCWLLYGSKYNLGWPNSCWLDFVDNNFLFPEALVIM